MEISQIRVKTNKREELIDITDEVQEIIRKSKISEGIVRVLSHTPLQVSQ